MFIFRSLPILLLWLSTGLSSSTAETGAYFTQLGDAYATYSSWLVTFTMNLTPYKGHLEGLEKEIVTVKTVFDNLLKTQVDAKMTPLQRGHFMSLANHTSKFVYSEVNQFYHEYWQINEAWVQLNTFLYSKKVTIRQKRAILPIVGDLLSSLFGTATKSDLHKIKQTLSHLQGNQIDIINTVQQGLTLMNKTNTFAKQNRYTLNKLINATNTIQSQVRDLKYRVLQLEPVVIFTFLQDKLHHLFHIVSSTLRQCEMDIQKLYTAIKETNQGQLPMELIPPSKLMILLRKISKRLPKGFLLPVDPMTKVQWYYRHLKAMLIPEKNRIHILTAIPLAHRESYFTVYEILAIPVPHPQVNMIAKYELEGSHIAISKDKASYILMDGNELTTCDMQNTAYCSFKQPVLPLSSPTCASSLFTNDQRAIHRYCKRHLTAHDKYPLVFYLHKGQWLIASRTQFSMHVSCVKDNEQILNTYEVSQPLQIFDLQSGCTAYSPHFKLLPYYMAGSTDEIKPILRKPVVVQTLVSNIWNFSFMTSSDFSNNINIHDLLMEDIPDLPIPELQTLLSKERGKLLQPMDTSPSWLLSKLVAAGLGVIMILLGIVGFYVKYRYHSISQLLALLIGNNQDKYTRPVSADVRLDMCSRLQRCWHDSSQPDTQRHLPDNPEVTSPLQPGVQQLDQSRVIITAE